MSINHVNFDKVAKVKTLVSQLGGWERIFIRYSGLAASLHRGTHLQTCPKTKQGNSVFRWLCDYRETGGAYHNDAGPMSDGIEVIAWYQGCTYAQALDELIGVCINACNRDQAPRNASAPRRQSQVSGQRVKDTTAVLRKVNSMAQPIAGTHAETYLRALGIQASLDTVHELGFHPDLVTRDEDAEYWAHYPSMLAMVRDVDGNPVTMQRTFLDPTQPVMADLRRPKMVFSSPAAIRGCAIQLDQPVCVGQGSYLVGISNSVESALRIRESTGTPMWAGLSNALTQAVQFPECVRYVLIYIDGKSDDAELNMARRLQARLQAQGRHAATLVLPCTRGISPFDWAQLHTDTDGRGFSNALKAQSHSKLSWHV
ncbi:DUF7146 domain-containing protein [Pseudoalteromonas rubra]|uniref:Uncharacterized protein n=1 Tax=Pseudoalteromonas rubra TaxID=43658 RepID=A0A0U3H0K6_9GAMM|nr:toprim domain-containing protein [Pseudoalteromonas rubra]ALU46126.1 hypothetical protein AT705_24500 [Pseudoalteromonas rubra]